jgi:hypothetical protein
VQIADQAARESWTPAEARKAVANAKRSDLPQDESLERDLKQLRKEVLRLDRERVAPSTVAEVQCLLRALQPLVKKEQRIQDMIRRSLLLRKTGVRQWVTADY